MNDLSEADRILAITLLDEVRNITIDDPEKQNKIDHKISKAEEEYSKGQQTPTGNTEFQFKAGDLNFHSSDYGWLVIAGHKAMYKGTGTINGAGNYGFIVPTL